MDGDPAVLARDGDHRLVLDVQLLLVADAVRALDHERGLLHGGRRIARLDGVVGELVVRHERVEGRRQRLGAQGDVAARLAQGCPVRRRDQGARLGLVADLAADRDEDRLVGVDEADDVVARDVFGGHDHDPLPVEGIVQVDAEEPGMGIGRADRGAEPRPGHDEIVGVQRGPGELGGALAAQRQPPGGHDPGPVRRRE